MVGQAPMNSAKILGSKFTLSQYAVESMDYVVEYTFYFLAKSYGLQNVAIQLIQVQPLQCWRQNSLEGDTGRSEFFPDAVLRNCPGNAPSSLGENRTRFSFSAENPSKFHQNIQILRWKCHSLRDRKASELWDFQLYRRLHNLLSNERCRSSGLRFHHCPWRRFILLFWQLID